MVENKELTMITDHSQLKEPNNETGYLSEFLDAGRGTDEENESVGDVNV